MNDARTTDPWEGSEMSIQEHDAPQAETAVPDDDVVPTSRKGALIGFTVVVTVALLLLGFALWPRYQTATASVSGQRLSADPVGQSAPVFSGVRLSDGKTMSLADLRGKTVVVNFWASWCIPCKDEAPALQKSYEKYRSQGLVVLGVDAQDFRGDAKRFARRFGVTYPLVYDGHGSTLGKWGVTGFPETFFVDRSGHLVGERIQGGIDTERNKAAFAEGLQRVLASAQ